ncbi:Nn.00g088390.m01.CDS01 [Neocucurbitaria sp. VM-36]
MYSLEGQRALLQAWAAGTGFVLDPGNQPKVDFARLAKMRGWVGGDPNWCLHWHACFGEVYCYGGQHTKAATTKTTPDESATPTVAPDLMDRMRRLSIDSDSSSFSIISAAPSVQSLDSNGSIAGGVTVLDLGDTEHGDLRIVQATADIASTPVPGKTAKPDTVKPHTESCQAKPNSSAPQSSPFWYQFPGFVPSATTTFKEEFARLAKHQAWGAKAKRKHQITALNDEVAFHYGTCMQKLDRWQELCQEVGIEKIPTSITQCKKALQSVFVNLFNLIDHRRNPEVKIVHFKSYGEFSRNVRAGNKFPRECAKQDGFIKVLLKKL